MKRLLLLLVVLLWIVPLHAQPAQTLSGFIISLHGDPVPGASGSLSEHYFLVDAQGSRTPLAIDAGLAQSLLGQWANLGGSLR